MDKKFFEQNSSKILIFFILSCVVVDVYEQWVWSYSPIRLVIIIPLSESDC